MKYFSTFSGIGGFELGIKKAIPDAECVGYSEIDPYAIKCYETHFPKHKNFGDISKIDIQSLPDFDLLVGGSPCTDLSVAKKERQGLEGEQSKLFFKFLEILKIKKPKYYILENVESMSDINKQRITGFLAEYEFNRTGEFKDLTPKCIDASLVSAQSRKRIFFTNFPLTLPEDRKIFLKDILEPIVDEKYFIRRELKQNKWNSAALRVYKGQSGNIYGIEGKSTTLCANGGGDGAKTGLYQIGFAGSSKEYISSIERVNQSGFGIRRLTPKECARLQCFPDTHCSMLSDSRAYKAYGNAVNVEVIAHIIECLKKVL